MKRLFAFGLFLIGFVQLACSSAAVNSNVSQQTPVSPAKSEPARPITVLVRKSDKDSCAADGLFYIVILSAIENKAAAEHQTTIADGTMLLTGDGLTIERESYDPGEKGKKKPEWKLLPQNFDFLVTWNTENKEHSKRSMNDALMISTNESITVEKVSAPSITKTWTLSYTLNAGSKMDAYEKTAEQQINGVIIPARGPVLKEIRAFILSNMSEGSSN